MKTKRPPKKAPAKKAGANVEFKFGDGRTGALPLRAVHEQLLKQFARMSSSDSPELRLAGEGKLAEVAARMESETMRRVGASKGGSSKQKAPDWHAPLLEQAQRLISSGTKPRDLVGKLTKAFPYDQKTIRSALKKAGVK